jgi:hypothetical protein
MVRSLFYSYVSLIIFYYPNISTQKSLTPLLLISDPKIPNGKWSLAKDETFDAASTRARLYDIASNLRYRWMNKSVMLVPNKYKANTSYDSQIALFTMNSIFALFTGLITLLSAFNLTANRKVTLLVLLPALTVSACYSYTLLNSLRVTANAYMNCNGVPNSTYYRTREATECRISDDSTLFDPIKTKYFTPSQHEAYQVDCSAAGKDKDLCNSWNACEFITDFVNKTEGTATTHGKSAVAKETCINKLMDGYESYKCTHAQEKYWRGTRKCGAYADMIGSVNVLYSAPKHPCGEETKWDKSSCLQLKPAKGSDGNITNDHKCTMDYTLVKTGCDQADKNMPMCNLGTHYFYNLDYLQAYNDDKDPKHKEMREKYEPCSNDKTIYGNLTKKYNDYYLVPRNCITDNKGGNIDVLAASFVTRVAVLRWGLAFYYIEICFLLLTVMHAYYFTSSGAETSGGAPPNLEMGVTGSGTSAKPYQPGQAKSNPLGLNQ